MKLFPMEVFVIDLVERGKTPSLTWPQREFIAIGIATGMNYLQNADSQTPFLPFGFKVLKILKIVMLVAPSVTFVFKIWQLATMTRLSFNRVLFLFYFVCVVFVLLFCLCYFYANVNESYFVVCFCCNIHIFIGSFYLIC